MQVLARKLGDGDAKTKTIFYLYLHFGSHFYYRYGSEEPTFDPAEYKLLEVLCRKYNVVVIFFRRDKEIVGRDSVIPENAKWLPLDDFPLTKNLPHLMRWPIETITRTLRVALLLWTSRPDLVDGNWITRKGGLYCALSRFHPFLATAWGEDVQVEAKKSRIFRMLGKLTVRAADAVIVDSEVLRKAVLDLGCNPSKICSFPRGIDLNRFALRKSTSLRRRLNWANNTIVVSTRNHFPVYGVENLIRAVPLVLEKTRNARFVIAGDGPLLNHHKSLTKDLGVEHYVKFLGRVDHNQIPKVLCAGDVYVSTSFSDGSSVSLLEGMACGLPVVVTRIPGNEEWVTEGENGFLVSPGDATVLAQRLTTILRQRKLRLKMGKRNRELVRHKANWGTDSLVFERCVSNLLASTNVRNSGHTKLSFFEP